MQSTKPPVTVADPFAGLAGRRGAGPHEQGFDGPVLLLWPLMVAL